jgi:hypothetical protein
MAAPRTPVVSAALLAEPEGKTEIPRGASLTTQWEHLGENRRRLDACVMTAQQQAMVIRALTAPTMTDDQKAN